MLASIGLRAKLDQMDSKESEGFYWRLAHDNDPSEVNLDYHETDLNFLLISMMNPWKPQIACLRIGHWIV